MLQVNNLTGFGVAPSGGGGGGGLMPVMTGYTSGDITVVASNERAATGFDAWMAFDGVNVNPNAWMAVAGTQWLKIDFGAAQAVSRYDIFMRDENNDMKTWTFQGSDNNSSWTTLDTQTNFVRAEGWFEFTLAATETYRYYRIHTTENQGNGLSVIIGEMQLYS